MSKNYVDDSDFEESAADEGYNALSNLEEFVNEPVEGDDDEQEYFEDNEDDEEVPDPPELKRESKSQYVDSNDYTSEDSEPSPPRPEPEQWSSSEEEDEEFKLKLRQREARKSIPRNIRKQIDIYVDQKLEESKQNKYLPPPISARDSSFSRNSFTPLYM